jgi:hypothetical protein
MSYVEMDKVCLKSKDVLGVFGIWLYLPLLITTKGPFGRDLDFQKNVLDLYSLRKCSG